MPEKARLADASPELRARLTESPIAFYRFVNRSWTREVCTLFAADLEMLPTVRLHGDAHVEQYAVTATARGLDDFDDSARGPAVVDMVRFLGSLELTARDRGWSASLGTITDAFLEGYMRALETPGYLPPDPAVVTRLRRAPARSAQEFLRWADSLMEPVRPSDLQQLDAGWEKLQAFAAQSRPEFTPAFMKRKKVGWVRLGIGSALSRKFLARVEGPSPAADDDVVIEAKEVMRLRDVPCLSVPQGGEAFRVVDGIRQIGRIQHRLVLALPLLAPKRPDARGWWVRTWEDSYKEVEISHLASADELRELAHDAGAQLGSANLVDYAPGVAAQKRVAELEGITRLEPRIRQAARDLTAALLEAWQQFRKS